MSLLKRRDGHHNTSAPHGFLSTDRSCSCHYFSDIHHNSSLRALDYVDILSSAEMGALCSFGEEISIQFKLFTEFTVFR